MSLRKGIGFCQQSEKARNLAFYYARIIYKCANKVNLFFVRIILVFERRA